MTKLLTQAPMFAQAFGTFRDRVGEALIGLMIIGFVAATCLVMKAGNDFRRGDDGMPSIIGAIVIGGAPVLVAAVFKVFGLDAATPSFP